VAAKLEWMNVGVAAVVAMALWQDRGDMPRSGDVIAAPITLVRQDAAELACILTHRVGRYRCAYQNDFTTWEPAPDPIDVLLPAVTTEGVRYLVAGLFQQTSLAEYFSLHHDAARVTAHCRLKLIELAPSHKRRFRRTDRWEKVGPTWVAEPIACSMD
jgi:hypothetical protein